MFGLLFKHNFLLFLATRRQCLRYLAEQLLNADVLFRGHLVVVECVLLSSALSLLPADLPTVQIDFVAHQGDQYIGRCLLIQFFDPVQYVIIQSPLTMPVISQMSPRLSRQRPPVLQQPSYSHK